MTLRNSIGTGGLFFAPCLGLIAACAQQPSQEVAVEVVPAPPLPADHPLQGSWEEETDSETISVTIEGNSLYFHRRPDFQYDTIFTLVPDSDPLELRATIIDSPRTTDSVGEVVTAIYAFEGDTLHLAAVDKVEGEPASFDEASDRYRLQRVQATE